MENFNLCVKVCVKTTCKVIKNFAGGYFISLQMKDYNKKSAHY